MFYISTELLLVSFIFLLESTILFLVNIFEFFKSSFF